MTKTKFTEFKKWCTDVGILGLQNIDYPHMFGSEGSQYPGVVAIKDIQPGEAILAIPFDQLVSVRRMDPDLKELIKDCPLFQTLEDNELLRLTLYLMDEFTKGEASKIDSWI